MAAWSKAWDYVLSLAGIVGSDPTVTCMSYLLRVFCVVRYSCLQRADHSSREVILSVMCLSVFDVPHREGLGPLGVRNHEKKLLFRNIPSTCCGPYKPSSGKAIYKGIYV